MSCWRLRALLAVLCCSATAAGAFELVVGAADPVRALRIDGAEAQEIAPPRSTPLGSLWKLFVYAYLVDRDIASSDYVCTGGRREEEVYCCEPGQHIDRERALVQSCGLYFAPARLKLDALAWSNYWRGKGAAVPAWLTHLDAVAPATEVSVRSLLDALASVDPATRQKTMHVLQGVTLEARARPLLSQVGTQLRVKTWSWHDRQGRRIGGFAGWLVDGTPLWLRGAGSSATAIAAAAPRLATHLPPSRPEEEACVSVHFFNRYPLAEVETDGGPARAGLLAGRVRARFQSGQAIEFDAAGKLQLVRHDGVMSIEGRFGLNDYVGRVIQREAAAQPIEAARALGVAARSYLARHADFAAGCYRIADDSRTQRVSPSPPSRAALAAAQWSDGLVLSGVAGHFHSSRAGPQRLSWQHAVGEAKDGRRWDEILDQAYGGAAFSLFGEGDAGECHPLPKAERWLAAHQREWRASLAGVPGFDPPPRLPRICMLAQGNPYADIERGRIYATGIATVNERLTVAHEFLHFGFADHPRGRDEDFVENTARRLLGLP